MGFRSVKQYAEAWENGRSFTGHFRKSFTATTTGWTDYSTHGGGPPANYYASDPLTAATLIGSRGFYHGDDKAPARKFLTRMSYVSNSPTIQYTMYLLDYLLYYPFVDCDDAVAQEMNNTVTLPRYTDGEGVMAMAVSHTAHTPSGSGSFVFEYVNQDGDTKTSPTNLCSTNTASPITAGSLIRSCSLTLANYGPWCDLAAGDRGIRQINSVTFTAPNGGLAAFVLVKPIATLVVREGNAQTEIEMVTTGNPPKRIYDGAYLNFIANNGQALTSSVASGTLDFIWDEGT